MAFQMCQGCDKSCLNFTQSEIKCQQKLLSKLSDQVRQTTNRKKINQMWKVAHRGGNAWLWDSHRSQVYLATCFLPAAASPCGPETASSTPESVLSWAGLTLSRLRSWWHLPTPWGRKDSGTDGLKTGCLISPRVSALRREMAYTPKRNGKLSLDLEF